MARQWDYEQFRVLSYQTSYTAGLDLGQKQDPSAVALIERTLIVYDARDAYTCEPITRTECRLVHAERIPLGTPYPQVVRRVCQLLNAAPPAAAEGPALVVDATGVGTPVVDLFRTRALPGRMVPVVITGGDSVRQDGGTFRVPKRDLVSGLQVAFESGSLVLDSSVPAVETLIGELMSMRSTVTARGHERIEAWREGAHDDLVLAVGLAWWWMQWRWEVKVEVPPPGAVRGHEFYRLFY
jgi:hypothetical protein